MVIIVGDSRIGIGSEDLNVSIEIGGRPTCMEYVESGRARNEWVIAIRASSERACLGLST